MGGCASRPKGSDEMQPEPLPIDAQVTPKEVDFDAKPPAEELKKDEAANPTNNVAGDEKINEAPLVDLSEPKQDQLTAELEPVSVADSNPVTEKEDKVFETAATVTASPVENNKEEGTKEAAEAKPQPQPSKQLPE